MVIENPPAPTETPEVQVTPEEKLSLHIYVTREGYERIKKFAEYAAIEEFIEGHPRGNFSQYADWCFHLGESYLIQHMLKKRGYK